MEKMKKWKSKSQQNTHLVGIEVRDRVTARVISPCQLVPTIIDKNALSLKQ